MLRVDGGGTVLVLGDVERGSWRDGGDVVSLARGLVAADERGSGRTVWCGGDGLECRCASNEGLLAGRFPNLSTDGGDAYPGRGLSHYSAHRHR